MSPELSAGVFLAVAAAVMGLLVWSVQRIVGRIDKIGAALEALATRVTVIETKQDTTTELAARADRVGRATAEKVGVDLPRDLVDTLNPSRRRTPRN
jgi:hypothetical protein